LRKLLLYDYNNGMNKHLLNKALKKAGSQAELARLFQTTRQYISNVKRGYPPSQKFIEFCEDYVKD
jgi:hypothetical protein